MATKYVRAHAHKFEGVYYYESQSSLFSGKPDRCYVVTFKVAGRKIWEKVGWKSKGVTPQVADAFRTRRLQEIQLGAPVLSAAQRQQEALKRNRLIDEIAQIYFDAKGGALKGYTTDINRYDKHLKLLFGKRRVSDLTPLSLDELKQTMQDKAEATKWNALELLRRIINYGAKSGLCPALGFTMEMPNRNNERVEYLTPEETGRLFAVMAEWPNQEPCRMLRLAYFTAMRKGEIFNLEDSDLDFQFNLIRLRNPKGKKTTSIPMNQIARQILEEQLIWRKQKYPGVAVVFPGKNGEKRVECTAVDRIKAKAGLPKAFRIFHGLRHHYAVTLANSGHFTLDMIAELLTHKSTAMTKRYGQFLPKTMQAAGEAAAALLNNIHQT